MLGISDGGKDDALLRGHDPSTLAPDADARNRSVPDRPPGPASRASAPRPTIGRPGGRDPDRQRTSGAAATGHERRHSHGSRRSGARPDIHLTSGPARSTGGPAGRH
jgi:hypothetical protein